MNGSERYADREHGGQVLAKHLAKYGKTPCVVYGLPRGGVITAREVAEALNAPLDVVVAKKLSHPASPEYAIGAVTEDGEVVLNDEAIGEYTRDYLERHVQERHLEAQERLAAFRAFRPAELLMGKTAILVDDGIATGYTVRAAVMSLKKRHPDRIVVAAPVASPDVVERLREVADEVVVPSTPHLFHAIGLHYDDFLPVGDAEALNAVREVFAHVKPRR